MGSSKHTVHSAVMALAMMSMLGLRLVVPDAFHNAWFHLLESMTFVEPHTPNNAAAVHLFLQPGEDKSSGFQLSPEDWRAILSELLAGGSLTVAVLGTPSDPSWDRIDNDIKSKLIFLNNDTISKRQFYTQLRGRTIVRTEETTADLFDRMQFGSGVGDFGPADWIALAPTPINDHELRRFLDIVVAKASNKVVTAGRTLEPWLTPIVLAILLIMLSTAKFSVACSMIGIISLSALVGSLWTLYSRDILADCGSLVTGTAFGLAAIFAADAFQRYWWHRTIKNLVVPHVSHLNSGFSLNFWTTMSEKNGEFIGCVLCITPVSPHDYESAFDLAGANPEEHAFLDELVESCKLHGAFVMKENSGTYALFAPPRNDDLEVAITSAIDLANQLQEKIYHRLLDAESANDVILPVRLGLNCGTVQTRIYRSGAGWRLEVGGTAMQVASRLAQACELFRVLVSESVASAFGNCQRETTLMPRTGLVDVYEQPLSVFEWNAFFDRTNEIRGLHNKLNSWIGRERKHHRWSIMDARVSASGNDLTGQVLNFSRTGFLLSWPEYLGLGMSIRLTLRANDGVLDKICRGVGIHHITVEVRRGQSASDGQFHLGVEIKDLDQTKRDVLVAALKKYAVSKESVSQA